ncbi:related to amidohydrolase family protein [Ustilago trichophora]|uniref:Related to amidohydrolase family protein n=1 Tax=Ustilago trichophora TaxID=86804 RepID=A0A5C3E2A7_9BASI|nr:related to amidohydrolase family protein [Ustilago trichophora]
MAVKLFKNALFFTAQAQELDAASLLKQDYTDASAVANRFAECIVVQDGKLAHVGDVASIPAELAKVAEEVDLGNGKLVVPGFIDGHTHLLNFGQSLDKIDVGKCKNLAQIQQKIKEAAEAKPDAPRILAAVWMQNSTDGKALASWLDEVVPDRPVYVESFDLHSHWCNTAALKELGITDDTPNPEGGEIVRDPETGKASGLLLEMANILFVWPKLANLATKEEQEASFHRACDSYHESGFTGGIDMALDPLSLDCILRVKEKMNGRLPIRVAAHWLVRPEADLDECLKQVRHAHELSQKHNDEWFRVVGIKLVCDGVIDSCTAALKEPYYNKTNAEVMWPLSLLAPTIQCADSLDLQVAVHAIGDQAVHTAVEAIATLGEKLAEKGLSIRDRRHRIEHLELTDPKDVEKLGKLGITASIQGVHCDPSIMEGWCKMLGDPVNEGRCARAFAFREFVEAGAPIALGSDAPTAHHWILPNLYTAVTRRSGREPEMEGRTTPQFALPLAMAVAAATYGAAHSCKADKWSGTLEQGKSADFVVMDTDLFKEYRDGDKEQTILKTKILQTWLQGEKVYQRSEETQKEDKKKGGCTVL